MCRYIIFTTQSLAVSPTLVSAWRCNRYHSKLKCVFFLATHISKHTLKLIKQQFYTKNAYIIIQTTAECYSYYDSEVSVCSNSTVHTQASGKSVQWKLADGVHCSVLIYQGASTDQHTHAKGHRTITWHDGFFLETSCWFDQSKLCMVFGG